MTGRYVELPSVKTWYEVEGEGDPLLLLHGGLCTNALWEPQRRQFAATYQLYLPERRGHGHSPDVDGPLSYYDMANDTAEFIEQVVDEPAHLVGWSDGGIVALLVAISHPQLVWKIVTIGANFKPLDPEGELGRYLHEFPPHPDPRLQPEFVANYEAVSPDGPDHWPVISAKVFDMFAREPNISLDDLGRIAAPTLVLVGDDDLIKFEHTLALYHAIPSAELAVVPGTSHRLLRENPELTNRIILDFLSNDPAPTLVPVRRAQPPFTNPER
jgi:pimeloyl-ACP methyl ester carboxylesterase